MMPLEIVFRESDALPLDGVADEDAGFIHLEWYPAQFRAKIRDAVPVHLLHGETEGSPLVRQRIEIQHFVSRSVRLLLVVIDQHHQVPEPVFTSTQSGFPYGAFVRFAVTYDDEDPVRRFGHPRMQ